MPPRQRIYRMVLVAQVFLVYIERLNIACRCHIALCLPAQFRDYTLRQDNGLMLLREGCDIEQSI